MAVASDCLRVPVECAPTLVKGAHAVANKSACLIRFLANCFPTLCKQLRCAVLRIGGNFNKGVDSAGTAADNRVRSRSSRWLERYQASLMSIHACVPEFRHGAGVLATVATYFANYTMRPSAYGDGVVVFMFILIPFAGCMHVVHGRYSVITGTAVLATLQPSTGPALAGCRRLVASCAVVIEVCVHICFSGRVVYNGG